MLVKECSWRDGPCEDVNYRDREGEFACKKVRERTQNTKERKSDKWFHGISLPYLSKAKPWLQRS